MASKDRHVRTGSETGAGASINCIGVVGAGVIGASWAAHFLRHGFDVVAHDPDPEAGMRLRDYLRRTWPILEELGLSENGSLERLRMVATLEELATTVDFVVENAPERVEAKQTVIAHIDGLAPVDVVIASSSSGIVPSVLQATCSVSPERVLVAHPFQPPHLMPLVEVVGGVRTSAVALEVTECLLLATGKRPIRLQQEKPGHVANRLQAALWKEAYALVADGVASVGDIDKAMTNGPGLRWALLGPFQTLHLTGGPGGIDHIHQHLGPTMQALWADSRTPEFDGRLQAAVSAGVRAALGNDPVDQLADRRDAALVELLALRAQVASQERGEG